MKPYPALLAGAMSAALACSGIAQIENKLEQANSHADARAEARADGNGQTQSQKQSVTVTSDGKRTIKKTVTVRDGKEEVVIETTDENGKTTTNRAGGDKPDAGKSGDKPAAEADDKAPWLGVQVNEAPQVLRDQLGLGDRGVVVDLVAPESPAAKAGIQRNDILLQCAGKDLATAEDLRAELRNHQAGESVKIEVLRKGERRAVDVTLAERPAAQDSPPQDQPDLDEKLRQHQDRDGESKMEIEVSGDNGGGNAAAGLDAVLNDPKIPDDFKKTVREMQERMKEFQKKHAPR